MNSAKAFVICPYNPKHKVLRKNLVKHKFKSHPVLYKKDLDASYKIKLDAQDASGYAVNDDEIKRNAITFSSKKMNSAEAFVICPYNSKHKVLRKNLVKHKFKSHPVLYKKDLDASYKIKLDAQDAAGYAVNDDEMNRLNEISKAIGEPEYWD
ncbi:hypothetical protein FQA39_LY13315 [Lamprigera yunnana]|nr:hypothetical protein FQA39_LY13315 [Lamprigera yunnana]